MVTHSPSFLKALVFWFLNSWQIVLLGLCMLFPRLFCGNRRVRGRPTDCGAWAVRGSAQMRG